MSAARWKGPLRSRILRSGWDHLFAGDGTTWLAILPVMGPPGVASGLPVVRPLYWPNEPPGGVGDRDQGDPAEVAAGSEFARGGPAVGHRPQDGAPLSRQGPRVRARPDGGGCQLTDELLAAVIARVRPLPDEGRGEMRSVAEGTRLSRWPTVTWPCGAPASASSCSKRIIVVDEIRRDSSWWEDVF